MDTYKTIASESVGEYEVKRSRFIATLRPVKSQEEAVDFINEMKKKYWDARHNCSAYVIGDRGEITRCSDDGEPPGTAGRPMLEVLLNEGLSNVCVVVTRYFGGVLLGTGGLVRAYRQSLKEGIRNARIETVRECFSCELKSDYTLAGKLKYLIESPPFILADTLYEEEVIFKFLVSCEEFEKAQNIITDATNGRLVIERIEKTDHRGG
ncbi:MAG: YigZ family protein [Lachnospiraceae bacterium]|nr:YigZ family protein [Lachnospiraceae bacterium]